jgi:hypothetical protein
LNGIYDMELTGLQKKIVEMVRCGMMWHDCMIVLGIGTRIFIGVGTGSAIRLVVGINIAISIDVSHRLFVGGFVLLIRMALA